MKLLLLYVNNLYYTQKLSISTFNPISFCIINLYITSKLHINKNGESRLKQSFNMLEQYLILN